MTNSKLSKTPSFTLTSTPIYPPEPPNPLFTTTAPFNLKTKTLTQNLCPHACTLSTRAPAQTHTFLYTLLILILITTSFRPVHSLPNFTSSQAHSLKVPTTVPFTSTIRSRRQLSSIASISTTAIPVTVSASILNSQTTTQTTSTIASPPLTPFCNFTEYPHSGCSPIFKAFCDRQSNSCICGTASNESEDHQRSSSNKFKTSRHRKRFCLNEAKLGTTCQSSGQCRATDANSGCFSTSSDFTNWKCSCISGYVEHLGACLPDPKLASDDENPYSRCTAMGLVYISILDRCVESSQMPYYAHRSAGRAGGGRGGGGGRGRGGVGGRATGSRSWYTSDRNLMRRGSGASRPNFCLSLILTLIYIIFSSL